MDKKYTFDEFTKLILLDFIKYFEKYYNNANELFLNLNEQTNAKSIEDWMYYFDWYMKHYRDATIQDIKLKLANDK